MQHTLHGPPSKMIVLNDGATAMSAYSSSLLSFQLFIKHIPNILKSTCSAWVKCDIQAKLGNVSTSLQHRWNLCHFWSWETRESSHSKLGVFCCCWLVLFLFWGRRSSKLLYSQRWPWICDPPASTARMWGLHHRPPCLRWCLCGIRDQTQGFVKARQAPHQLSHVSSPQGPFWFLLCCLFFTFLG